MHELEKIYDDFYEIDVRNHFEIVQFYEKNQLILDNKSKFNDTDDLKIWLDASKSRKRNSINVYLYVTAALLFIIEFSVGRNMLSSETKLLMIKIAFLIFMTAIVNEYLYDKIMKWIKK